MAATDPAITLAYFLKWEAPDGDVRLCDGGFLNYASERYDSRHAVFGAIHESEAFEAGFGDMAEMGALVLAPAPGAALADWWRVDLEKTRLRIWQGELDSDLKTVSTAKQVADWLVDTAERQQGVNGEDLLRLEMMGRAERLFVQSEANTLSDRHHQSVWSGERGFENCHDGPQFFAWGTATPAAGSGFATGGAGSLAGGVPTRTMAF